MKFIFSIDKIENGQVMLNSGDGKIIQWPAEKLPQNIKENDKIVFNIGEEENQAKNILNEILGQG